MTLLEELEQEGFEIPYQCRAGYCGTCRVRVIRGSVTYIHTPMAWINDNEILPCCCTADSDLVLHIERPQ